MWEGLQHEKWFDRWNSPEVSTSDEKMKEFERLKKEAGADL